MDLISIANREAVERLQDQLQRCNSALDERPPKHRKRELRAMVLRVCFLERLLESGALWVEHVVEGDPGFDTTGRVVIISIPAQ